MADVTLGGHPATTNGDLPAEGSTAPSFTLTTTKMGTLSSSELAGRNVVLNIFPSVDTGVCAASVREFNKRAADLTDTEVVCVSADLPFAQARFCGAEGLDGVQMASTFRGSSFLADYGVQLESGKFEGLAARAVVVYDTAGTVLHAQLVPEIGQEPDYDAALRVL